MCFSEDTPPSFNRSCDEYQKWKRKFAVWRTVTERPVSKQGGLLILSLDDVTQSEVLDLIDISEIKKKKGVHKILNVLDDKFQKEASITAYEAYQQFESCTRSAEVSILNHCDDFNRKYLKVKNGGNHLTENVLALKLLQSANLSDYEVTLIKATVPELSYDEVLKQLKKTYVGMRTETKEAKNPQNTLYNEANDMLFKAQKRRKSISKKKPQSTCNSHQGNSSLTAQNFKNYRGRNETNTNRRVRRCNFCESINHKQHECPDLQSSKSSNSGFIESN